MYVSEREFEVESERPLILAAQGWIRNLHGDLFAWIKCQFWICGRICELLKWQKRGRKKKHLIADDTNTPKVLQMCAHEKAMMYICIAQDSDSAPSSA